MTQNKEESGKRESQAKRVRELIKKQKGLLKAKQKLAEFKEPVALLIRRSGETEFYESVSKGQFPIVHTDGDSRNIEIVPSRQLTFPYADRRVRLYILHEDYPVPLPDDPSVTSELISLSQKKVMQDIDKYKMKADMMKTKNIFTIFIGVALVIGAIGLVLLLTPQHVWDTILKKGVEEATKQNAEPANQKPLLGSALIFMQYFFRKRKYLKEMRRDSRITSCHSSKTISPFSLLKKEDGI